MQITNLGLDLDVGDRWRCLLWTSYNLRLIERGVPCVLAFNTVGATARQGQFRNI